MKPENQGGPACARLEAEIQAQSWTHVGAPVRCAGTTPGRSGSPSAAPRPAPASDPTFHRQPFFPATSSLLDGDQAALESRGLPGLIATPVVLPNPRLGLPLPCTPSNSAHPHGAPGRAPPAAPLPPAHRGSPAGLRVYPECERAPGPAARATVPRPMQPRTSLQLTETWGTEVPVHSRR